MIRKLLATTAVATLIASGAVAQTTTPAPTDPAAPMGGAEQTQMTVHAEGHLASNLIGESVYNGTGDDAENIGEVTDLVISNDGNVEAIVVGVGGFLGIGQKEVALEYDLAQWSEQPDGERWLVVETTRDALEAQQEFDRAAYRPMPADADVAQTQPATADDLAVAPTGQDGAEGTDTGGTTAMAPSGEAGDTTAAAPAGDDAADADGMAAAPTGDTAAGGDASQDMAATDQQQTQDGQAVGTDQTQTAAIDRSQLQDAQQDQIRADNLTGTTVYGANEENIGEIGDVILTPEGDVDAVIVDVGGFLGIGEKEVAVGIDNLAFMTDEDGDLYLFTQFTREELEAQPAYDESTYAEQRDDMRLRAQ